MPSPKKQTKPRKPTRTQQLELDTLKLLGDVTRQRVELQNNYSKVNADLANERVKVSSLESEVRGLKVSITNVESKYMEQKGRADALEIALRFAQKVPEKGAPAPATTVQEKATIDAARRCVSNMMAESFGTPRRPY